MLVNASKVKALRQEKNWTQQHLADACAISLRTVQRVERYGNASHETLMSLAAVFEVSQDRLSQEEEPVIEIEQVTTVDKRREIKLIMISTLLGMLIGSGIMLVFG